MDALKKRPPRSRLPKQDARQRYVEMGELAVLQKIQEDSRTLDEDALPVGPFARLDAAAVAARDGKTRGAVTNLFGSQAAFQTETMALALSAGDWIAGISYPAPTDFPSAEDWVDALFAAEAARGPRHAAEPEISYAFLWALWLSAVPYGIWSRTIAEPSMREFGQWLDKLEAAFAKAVTHFGVSFRESMTARHLACSAATLIEGAWLNQCLTGQNPADTDEPIATVLQRAGRMLWHGATMPCAGK